ncbi:MAG: polyprenyl synthetase family protein [Eubacterium sp.]
MQELKKKYECVEKIAKNVGIAFQIQDDILDVTNTTEVLGKPVFSDEKNHKSTYVSICGLITQKRR